MPLFEDVRSSGEAPRVVSDDSHEYQQQGLMWKRVTSPQHEAPETKQILSPPRAVSVPPSHRKPAKSPPKAGAVAGDIESAVAGLLGISHGPQDSLDPNPPSSLPPPPPPSLPEKSESGHQISAHNAASTVSAAAMAYDPPRVPSYAALAVRDTSDTSTKTVRLVPSKPRREAVPTISLLPMKPKKSKCHGPRNHGTFKTPTSAADVSRHTDMLLKRGRGRPKRPDGPKRQGNYRPSIVNLGRQSGSGRQIKRPKPFAQEVFGKNGRPPEFSDSDESELATFPNSSENERVARVSSPSPPRDRSSKSPMQGNGDVNMGSQKAKRGKGNSKNESTDQVKPTLEVQKERGAVGKEATTVPKSGYSTGTGRVVKVPKKFSDGVISNVKRLDSNGGGDESEDKSSNNGKDSVGSKSKASRTDDNGDSPDDEDSSSNATEKVPESIRLGSVVPNSIAPPVEVVAETVTGRVVKKPISFACEIFGKNGRKPVPFGAETRVRTNDPPKRRTSDSSIQKGHTAQRRNSDSSREKEQVAKRGHPVKHARPKPSVEKRGPGRPPKHPSKNGTDISQRRGPGRPRKVQPDTDVAKRGPGRPKKHPPRVEVATQKKAEPNKVNGERSSRRSFVNLSNGNGKRKETIEDMFKAIVQTTVASTGAEQPAKRATRHAETTQSSPTRRGRNKTNGGERKPRETLEDMFKAIVEAETATTLAERKKPVDAETRDTSKGGNCSVKKSLSDYADTESTTLRLEKQNPIKGENGDTAKKKRGRPKKSELGTAKNTDKRITDEDNQKPEKTKDRDVVVKRKRGRPKKSDFVDTKTEPPAHQEETDTTVEFEGNDAVKRKRGRPKKSDVVDKSKSVQPPSRSTVEDMFHGIVQASIQSTLTKGEGGKTGPTESVKDSAPDGNSQEHKKKRGRPPKDEADKAVKRARPRTPSPVLGLRPKEQAELPWKRSSKKPKLFTNEIFGKNGHLPGFVEEENVSGKKLNVLPANQTGGSDMRKTGTLKNELSRKSSEQKEPKGNSDKLGSDAPDEVTSRFSVDRKSTLARNGTKMKNRNHSTHTTIEGKPELVNVGSQIEIYWEGDKQYFGGVVRKLRDHQKAFYVVYDDGDREWIDLGAHKFRLVGISVQPGTDTTAPLEERDHDLKPGRTTLSTGKDSEPKKKVRGSMIQKVRRGKKRNSAPEDESGPGLLLDDPEDNVYGLTVGSRVAVYWEGDRRYFNGKVTQKRSNHRKNFYIEYDDGDHEWVDFDDHKFRVFVDDSDDLGKDHSSHSDVEDTDEKHALEGLREDYSRGNISNIRIGSRIAVYWDGDCEYFKARVTDRREGGRKCFHLKYDDGENQWVDLRRQKFVQLPDKRPRGRPRIYPRIARED